MRRGPAAKPVAMPRSVYRQLKLIARRQRLDYRIVVRARIILRARDGWGTTEIARALGVSSRTVRKWKRRFRQCPKAETLLDADRSGRPPRIPLFVRCTLIKLACERPDGDTTPFRDVWTHAALADALAQQVGHRISTSEVGRILRFDKLRPHRVVQWLHSPDPNFVEKA